MMSRSENTGPSRQLPARHGLGASLPSEPLEEQFTFRPERFEGVEGRKRSPYEWSPFRLWQSCAHQSAAQPHGAAARIGATRMADFRADDMDAGRCTCNSHIALCQFSSPFSSRLTFHCQHLCPISCMKKSHHWRRLCGGQNTRGHRRRFLESHS